MEKSLTGSFHEDGSKREVEWAEWFQGSLSLECHHTLLARTRLTLWLTGSEELRSVSCLGL